jgi:CBS domain-containing protein
MKVQDVMTRNVRSCRLDSNLAEAVKDMWEADCGVLPVVGHDNRVVGVITDRDICIAVATKGRTADRIAVREVVRDHVHTCLSTETTTAALKTMQAHKVRRLPVVDVEGHLEGILSLNDIATHAGAATPSQIAHTLERLCEHRAIVQAASAA